jgi:DNA polymerase-3 subunit gamma/tau
MEQLNILLNAGHSPAALARQLVRYLRNALMARLGGEKTELLQISADERARAARTAQLFSEEEITRNLQIMLSMFDDLNETQEHRFHLELGLLKLVHAQRLLPLEELLSGLAGGAPVRSTSKPAGSRPTAAPVRSMSATGANQASGFTSPFGGWNPEPGMKQSADPASVAEMERPVVTQTATMVPDIFPKALQTETVAATTAIATVSFETASEEIPVRKPLGSARMNDALTNEALTVETLRLAVISALADAGHASAAQLLGAGAWALEGSGLRIEVASITKKMLSLTVNAAAEKIMRQEMQRLGAPSRFLIVPGEGGGAVSAGIAAPIAGSIQESALAHPLVQRAREIFKAEVRSVVDLRTK